MVRGSYVSLSCCRTGGSARGRGDECVVAYLGHVPSAMTRAMRRRYVYHDESPTVLIDG